MSIWVMKKRKRQIEIIYTNKQNDIHNRSCGHTRNLKHALEFLAENAKFCDFAVLPNGTQVGIQRAAQA